MKLRTLCATALVGLVIGGGVAFAAPMDPMDTTGTVNVTEGEIDTDTEVTDPENPDEKLPPVDEIVPNPNPDRGPLEISHAPALKFGTIKTSTAALAKAAEATVISAGVNRGAVLQFGDLRTETHGYTVTASLSQQFTKGSDKLSGSTILFTNPYSATATGATGDTPTFNETFEIGETDNVDFGGAQTVATATATATAGKGLWVVEYGSNAGFGSAEDTTADSVFLNVPANTASSMTGGDYEAIIEWSINTTPGN